MGRVSGRLCIVTGAAQAIGRENCMNRNLVVANDRVFGALARSRTDQSELQM